MAEFKDNSMWMKVCLLLMPISHLLQLISYASGAGGVYKVGSYAAHVCAFLFILTALLLILCIVFLDEVKGNKIAVICFIIFAILGGLIMIIAIAIHGTAGCAKVLGTTVCASPFTTMLAVVAGLLAILAGVFAILDLVGCKGAKITVSVS